MTYTDTIAGLATPRGKGALAIIRVTGTDSIPVILKCIKQKKSFSKLEPNKIHLFDIYDKNDEKIDQITLIKYVSPKSYTGEDMVEIISHGGEIIIDKILYLLVENGVRFADKGEFTRRAFLHGKLDILRAEAIHSLITSQNELEHKNAIRSYSAEYTDIISETREKIKRCLIEIESRIEFGEEDSVVDNEVIIGKKDIISLRTYIEDELRKREKIKKFEKGIRLVIAGEPNVGKSTLFNTILQSERSIVHHIEGTTRDYVTESVYINEMHIHITDTAGLRDTEESVEKIGIDRSWEQISKANFLIIVTSAEKDVSVLEEKLSTYNTTKNLLVIINKTDVADPKSKIEWCKKEALLFDTCSLYKQEDTERIVKQIIGTVESEYSSFNESSIVINKRQESALIKIIEDIKHFEDEEIINDEILAYHLNAIMRNIDQYCGRITDEEILDSIFSEFCVGK